MKFITKASAGAAIGVAAFMLLKSERNHIQKEKVSKNKAKKEQLFI
ncbi:MAG: hypothetical protein JXR07_00530 [Reichenbachiella sp.]